MDSDSLKTEQLECSREDRESTTTGRSSEVWMKAQARRRLAVQNPDESGCGFSRSDCRRSFPLRLS